MTLFMPPIQRKKKVEEKYNPDSYRVISEDAVSDHPKYKPIAYRASFEPPTPVPPKQTQVNNNASSECDAAVEWYESPRPMKNTRVLPQILPDYRFNKPHPKACGFLDRNVRFLNEPICNVYTKPVQHEEKQWWPIRPNPGELNVPPFTEDSSYRTDYNCRYGPRPNGSGRHTAHNEREAALGTVPVNYLRERDGSQRFYKEGVSYEHQYNSRWGPNYPIRGKRHGAFVWSRMDPISQKKFVEYYQKLEEDERQARTEGGDSPCSPTSRVFVARSANNNSTKSGTSSPKRRLSGQPSAKSVKSVNLPVQHEVIHEAPTKECDPPRAVEAPQSNDKSTEPATEKPCEPVQAPEPVQEPLQEPEPVKQPEADS